MKISIIIACYNSETTILRSINSAVNQTYKNIEIVIVDGGSTDSTLDIVKSAKGSHDVLIFSEPDDGIADAWNKGVKLSTGDYIYFLNSDDYIDSNYIENVVKKINNNSRNLVYGNTFLVNEGGKVIKDYTARYKEISRYLGFGFFFTSVFIHRSVFTSIGGFNVNRKIAIDTDFLFRAEANGVSFQSHGQYNYMQVGGVSQKYRVKAYKEYFDVMRTNGYSKVICYLFYFRIKVIEFIRGLN
ncbi:glycosyltransferase [Shewanella algae]|uniref:glycosyltransferase family 2 protein n=1 Tax=Shewanella algae TaxID=38313 RepID=UPI001AAE0D03|nr:glycosyltransferase family 2 protein [Shewanella algae]MBO2611447.1 glycosyltransferase [Shewanella algae]UZD59938.1 glycosyltransferase [Shewanella algae]